MNDILELWIDLLGIKENMQGIWLLMGEFNKVRVKENIISEDCITSMEAFNSFLRDVELFHFSMGRRSFTRMCDDDRCLSKIYCFLSCSNFLTKWTIT